jgi:hypothetical protein
MQTIIITAMALAIAALGCYAFVLTRAIVINHNRIDRLEQATRELQTLAMQRRPQCRQPSYRD